jgi:hypothetical protein
MTAIRLSSEILATNHYSGIYRVGLVESPTEESESRDSLQNLHPENKGTLFFLLHSRRTRSVQIPLWFKNFVVQKLFESSASPR